MKHVAAIVTLLVLVMVFTIGCSGISKDSYDAAIKEATEFKSQLTSVQANLTTAQADLSKSKTDLATAQQSLTSMTAERDPANMHLPQILTGIDFCSSAS